MSEQQPDYSTPEGQEAYAVLPEEKQDKIADDAQAEADFVSKEIQPLVSDIDAAISIAERLGDEEALTGYRAELKELMDVKFEELPEEFRAKLRSITSVLREYIKETRMRRSSEDMPTVVLSDNEQDYLAYKLGTHRERNKQNGWEIFIPFGINNPEDYVGSKYYDFCYFASYLANNQGNAVITFKCVSKPLKTPDTTTAEQ